MADCLNCGTVTSGRFCSNCGQKTSVAPMNWRWLINEIQHSIFHVDRGILFTAKQMFVRPGHAVGEYLAGKRKRYFPPLSMILIPAAIYGLLIHFFEPDLSSFRLNTEARQSMDSMVNLIKQRYALIELGVLPVFAFCSWLLLKKYGHNYIEHIIINAYLTGQRILLNILVLPTNMMGAKTSMAIGGSIYLVYLGYWIFTFAQLYERRRTAGPVLRALSAFILFYVFLLLCIIVWAVATAIIKKSGTT